MKIHDGISITVMVSKLCLFAYLFLRKNFEKRKKNVAFPSDSDLYSSMLLIKPKLQVIEAI